MDKIKKMEEERNKAWQEFEKTYNVSETQKDQGLIIYMAFEKGWNSAILALKNDEGGEGVRRGGEK